MSHLFGLLGLVVKQVTRGHNIVADGWAGVANHRPHPMPHPTPLPTQTHSQKNLKRSFSHFATITSTDRRTSYTVACPQPKRYLIISTQLNTILLQILPYSGILWRKSNNSSISRGRKSKTRDGRGGKETKASPLYTPLKYVTLHSYITLHNIQKPTNNWG